MASSLADYLTKEILVRIYNIANSSGIRIYVVGEFVRDFYLSRKSNRIEIVVEGDALAFGRIVGMNTKTHISYFKNFGVATLGYKGDEIVFTSAKKGINNNDGRKPTYVPGTIKDDLRLRDFTINALAISLNSSDFGTQIDLFEGLKDISQGVIRTPLQPDYAFRYNPLLMLRAIRLASQLSTPERKFQIASGCLDAIWKYADKVDSVAKERVSEELNNILLCDVPSTGIKLLEDLRILRRIIPALSATKGVEKVDGIGHADSFPHSLMVLDNIVKLEAGQSSDCANSLGFRQGEPNLWLRWAALLHEIGKPATKRYVQGKGWTFNGYDVVGAKMISNVFSSLKMPLNDKMRYVQKLLSLQLRPKSLLEKDTRESAYRRLLYDAGDDILDLMLLCQANITTVNKVKANKEFVDIGRVKQQLLEVKAKEAIRNFKNPISANYIMDLYGLEPCNTLGVLKGFIKNAIINGEIGNTFEEADILLRKKAAEMGLTIKSTAPDKQESFGTQQSNSEAPSDEDTPGETKPSDIEDTQSPLVVETVAQEEVQEVLSVPVEASQEESLTPHSSRENADYSEIIRAFNECGISKLFLITSEEEFNTIQESRSLVRDSFALYTHDFSREVRKESMFALEVDLRVLTLPGTVITFEEFLSNEILITTEVSNIQLLKADFGALCLPPNNRAPKSILSSCVVIVKNSIPVEYITNYDAMSEEYSSSLPF